ncbi:MAG: BamA/TamA family outer membrane protein [Phycisphaerales bacterium]|nr:MAG: BamA/TamA family outer membrane protein [Phycisphaerales bacterium]
MRDAVIIVSALIVLLGGGCASTKPEASRSGRMSPEGTAAVEDGEIEVSAAGSRGDIVRSIDFVGNRKYKAKTLLKRLDFKVGDYLDLFVARAGRQILVDIHQRIGFAFVKVTVDEDKLSQGRVVYQIDEGPRVRVASVKFVGNEAIGAGTLRKVIKTKTRKWFVRPHYYNVESVTEDTERLQQLYYDRGYLDHSITAKEEFTTDKRKVRVTFTVHEGPAYRIERVVFVGNERFGDEQLQLELEIAAGQVYRKQRADLSAKRIARFYRERGFIDAQVQQRPKYSPDVVASLVDVEFEIMEGRQFRIGRIDITGNTQCQDKVVRRVLDEYDFVPGKLYNADMAPKQGGGKLERNVQMTVLAEDAVIRPIQSASGDPNQKDVSVDIKEGMTGMIMPGVGVSSDSGLIGRLMYQQRNFDITDWPDSLGEFLSMRSFRGAGQTLRVSLEPGTRVNQYSVSFTEPYFRDKPVQLDVVGSSWERWRESYDESRLKGYIGFEQRRKSKWRRSIGFRGENVDVHNIHADAPVEISNVAGENTIFGVRLGTGKTVTDDKFTPSTGYSFRTSYEQVTGDHSFGILLGNYVHYMTLREDVLERKTVLAAKVRAGTVVGDAPPFEKFYAGGSSGYSYGIRGFRYRGISTRGLQVGVPTPAYVDPIGSDWIFLANAEVTVPLIGDNFGALLFVDSGIIDSGGYRASIGTGIQIILPQWLGPVPMRFEIATPLMKEDEDEVQFFSFSMGTMF